jgi:dual specificity MAP kinase phosphatase
MVFTRAMHLARPTVDTSGPEHGLSYSHDFLTSLPVLIPRPDPHTPVRALSAQQFDDLHARSTTTHAPDNAIFPFLHGLEGSNAAQNSFFAADATDSHGRLRLPRFRGLIWVSADDADATGNSSGDEILSDSGSEPLSSDDDEDGYSNYGGAEDAFGMHMDVDPDAEPLAPVDPNAGTHMHPVAHRTSSNGPFQPSPSTPTVTAQHVHATTHHSNGDILDLAFASTQQQSTHVPHDRRASNASSTVSSVPESLFDTASVSSASTPPASPQNGGTAKLPSSSGSSDRLHQQPPHHHRHGARRSGSPMPKRHPLFTSTFFPRELLKCGPAGLEPEFIEPVVPAGISLRNFGIQVVRDAF